MQTLKSKNSKSSSATIGNMLLVKNRFVHVVCYTSKVVPEINKLTTPVALK